MLTYLVFDVLIVVIYAGFKRFQHDNVIMAFRASESLILKTSVVHEKYEIHESNQWVISFMRSPVWCRRLL